MVEIPVKGIAETLRLASSAQVQQRTAEHPVDVLASSSMPTSSGRIKKFITALDSIIDQLSPL